jgi:hypothetical protein
MVAKYSPKDTDVKDMISVNTVLVIPSIACDNVFRTGDWKKSNEDPYIPQPISGKPLWISPRTENIKLPTGERRQGSTKACLKKIYAKAGQLKTNSFFQESRGDGYLLSRKCKVAHSFAR